jgi:CyaY protein
MLSDTDFDRLATQALQRIEAALEASGIDADFELKEGGVLEIEFADGSKMIVNRHGAAREIWVAARAGGFHFRWDGATWRDTRDASELFAALSKLISAQGGEAVLLRP